MIQCLQENHAMVIAVLAGKLDMYNIPELRQKIEERIGAKPKTVIVDLQAVELIDSSAIGFLFYLQNFIRESGGMMALTNLTDHVQKVLASIRALSIFACYENTAEALAAARAAA